MDGVPDSKRPRFNSNGLPNPHLSDMSRDNLYHLGYKTDDGLPELFGDVQVVVIGGSPNRMKSFALFLADQMKLSQKEIEEMDKTKTDRFSIFKVRQVLSISHGMGVPSVTILLHELCKLLRYAKCDNPCIIRIGTSGGIGVPAGTVVITDRALNAALKDEHDVYVLGKQLNRPTVLHQGLREELMETCKTNDGLDAQFGATLCTDDFYEGQGRIDGAHCQYTKEEQQEYLQTLRKKGVKNIEMEATAVAALCHAVGIACAIVCVTLLNRLDGDQVNIEPDVYADYQLKPQRIVTKYILNRLRY